MPKSRKLGRASPKIGKRHSRSTRSDGVRQRATIPDIPRTTGPTELPVYQTSVDVTYDEMMALPSESVEIVPDPGNGKILAPFCAILQMNDAFGSLDIGFGPQTLRLTSSVGGVTRLGVLRQADSQFYQLFTANGGAVLGILQRTANTISDDSYAMTALADAMAGALEMRVFGHGDDTLPPVDEGGYPDAVLRATVIYSIIDLAP